MIFQETPISGAYVVIPERREDERGYFARIWCHQEFQALGLNPDLSQSSVSYNSVRGTLRGLHWQESPCEEAKLVRCVRGAIWDVVVDLRRAQPTFRQHFGVRLSVDDGRMLYVPEGCAHGFLTLADDTEVLYFISADYAPERQRGARWNDPAFEIVWPEPVRVISDRDRNYPDFVK